MVQMAGGSDRGFLRQPMQPVAGGLQGEKFAHIGNHGWGRVARFFFTSLRSHDSGNVIPLPPKCRMLHPMRWIALLPAILLASLSHGGETEKPLEVSLISESRSIRAGRPFFLGLHLIHPPGSHTYWKNPGIVGLATTVEWDLPPGFSAGEIQWPAPQAVSASNER